MRRHVGPLTRRPLRGGKEPMSSIEVVILGSGTSHGVPMIGCKCAVCVSDDSRDKRTRPSIWVRADERAILIDTAPELRLQCLAQGIDRVDVFSLPEVGEQNVALGNRRR